MTIEPTPLQEGTRIFYHCFHDQPPGKKKKRLVANFFSFICNEKRRFLSSRGGKGGGGACHFLFLAQGRKNPAGLEEEKGGKELCLSPPHKGGEALFHFPYYFTFPGPPPPEEGKGLLDLLEPALKGGEGAPLSRCSGGGELFSPAISVDAGQFGGERGGGGLP